MGVSRRSVPLLLILAAAASLRLYALADLPPAHYRDIALTANDALRAAAGHPRLHLTYDEGLYADLMGLVFLLFGASDWTVRLPGALFGVLTCWGVLRLGRALGLERAGLLGAALLSVSFWHVLLSRSGFRAVLLPCLLAHSMALLVEGMRGRGRLRLVMGGALFGLGVHVYPAVRFAPLFLPAYWIVESRASGEGLRPALRKIGLFAAAAFVVALPMLLHYTHHPEHFNDPRRFVSVFSPKVDKSQIPEYLEANLLKTLLMFHVHGDDNRRHNLKGAPMLDPASGLLFLLGLVLIVRTRSATGGDMGRRSATAALVLGWLFAMLLPNILSVEGVPHGLRSCGVLPVVALLSGIGLEATMSFLDRRLGLRVGPAFGIALLVLIGGFTAFRYFTVWGHDPEVAADHDAAYRAAARLLVAAPPGTRLLVVANGTGYPAYGHPIETQVYLFEMRDRLPETLGPKDAARAELQGEPALVAFIRRDERALELLHRLNPGAPVVEVQGPGLSPESPVYRVNWKSD